MRLFGITRFETHDNLFSIFGKWNIPYTECPRNDLIGYANILREEISYDRQFITESDFLKGETFSTHDIDFDEIVSRMISIIEYVNPKYVMLGHPDNWIATTMARICEIKKIPCGYALEILPSSNLFFSSFGLALNNPRIRNIRGIESTNTIDGYSKQEFPLENLLVGRIRQSLRENTGFFSRITLTVSRLVKKEISLFVLLVADNWSTKERWKYIYRPRFIFDSFYRGKRFVNYVFTQLYLRHLEKRGVKCFGSLTSENRISIFLHSGPEAAQLWYGRNYVNQIALADKVARDVRDKRVIFIKEHPAQDLRFRDITFYRELSKRGYCFIPREYSLSKDFEESDFIISINGSVALEAAFRGISCFLADEDHWYTLFPSVFPLSHILEILENPVVPEFNNLQVCEKLILELISYGVLFRASNDQIAQWINVDLESNFDF